MAHAAESQPASKILKRKKTVSEDEPAKHKSKKQKKERHDPAEGAAHPDASSRGGDPISTSTQSTLHPSQPENKRKIKKREKEKTKTKKKKKEGEKAKGTGPATTDNESEAKAADDEHLPAVSVPATDADAADESAGHSKTRFIVFVGNLPYTATLPVLESHFSSLKPTSIRHITDKTDSSKSKGFAFLEFAHYDRMRTCLKLFHHSMFDDGKSPARRINVELTAGGGGSGKGRKEKLKVKNQKLGEQRKRSKAKGDEDKATPKQKGGKQKRTDKAVPTLDNGNNNDGATAGNVHPSRRGRIDGRS